MGRALAMALQTLQLLLLGATASLLAHARASAAASAPASANVSSTDAYEKETRAACVASRSPLSCAWWRAVRWAWEATQAGSAPLELRAAGGAVRLVTLEGEEDEGDGDYLLPEAQPRAHDTQIDKVFRFALRRVEAWARQRAIALPLEPRAHGLRLADLSDDQDSDTGTARGKKKKLALLLPLALFFKLKALLVPILLGVLVIKKMLVVAAVLLPSLLGLVKVCKPHAPHHVTLHGGYGGGGYSAGGGDWATGAGSEYSPSYGYDASRRHAPPRLPFSTDK